MAVDLDVVERPGLDAEISLAFGSSATSSFVSRLVAEVEKALASAKIEAEKPRRDALDPQLSKAGQRNARELAGDAEFHRDRLQAALEKLRLRLVELKDQEEDAKRRVAYDKAAAERDAVAEELRSVYPEVAERLVALFSRLQQSNYELGQINEKLPKGAARLELAEFVAKGIVGKNMFGQAVSVTTCVLPPWTPYNTTRWPK
jgi:hypothetical protein